MSKHLANKHTAGVVFGGVLLALGLAVFPGFAAMAAEPEAAAPAAAASATAEELTFFDSLAFDKDLADTLAKQPSGALVVPSGPFSPNALPPRLEKWLSVVSKSGGSVRLKKVSSEPPSRGILSDVVELSVKSHQDAELSAMYAAAKSYDVLVTFNGNDVTGIQFNKRPAAAPAK